MKNQSCSRRVTLSILSISILFTSNAWGAIHGWDVHEVFSNEDGTIQFVELVEALGLNGENLFANRALISDGAIVVTLANIAFQTANKKYLFATAGAAALPDFPTPDFALPDGFLNTAGDTIKFCSNVACSVPIDTFSYVTPLPTDGVTSLQRDGLDFVEVVNSPTNFAGETISIDVSEDPEPEVPSMGAPGFALLVLGLMLVSIRKIRMPALQQA